MFEREKKNDTLLETQKIQKNRAPEEDKQQQQQGRQRRQHGESAVTLPSELKKIEEFLADAATDKALEAKATYTDQTKT